jgi:SdrD B-like domain
VDNQDMPKGLKARKIFKNRRDYRFLMLLLAIFSILICAFLPGWINVNTPTSELPFSLHSVKEADYTTDRNRSAIPAISLNIVEEVMRDNNVSEAEIAVRVGTLSSSLLTPVPMSTGTISVPNIPATATPIKALPTFSTTRSPAPTTMLATPNPTPLLPTAIPPTPQIYYPPAPTETPEDDPQPAIALKSSVSGYADKDTSGTITLNDDLQYQFIVTNTGETILSNISVRDNSFGGTITCPTATLAIGASMTCTADTLHSITLPEANAGSVSMNATALSAYKGNSYSKPANLSTTVSQNPAISLEKTLDYYTDNDSSSSITEDDALWYKFKIINSGNVSVSNLSITDDTFSLSITCPPGTLDPGLDTYCHATTAHTVTSAEATAGEVTNTATAFAQFNAAFYTSSDSLVTPVDLPASNPAITIIKSLASYDDNDSSGYISSGDGLNFAFVVTNSGNVTLTNIQVSDLTFSIPVSCPATSLIPAASMVCNTDSAYIISVGDAITGQVSNTASAAGDYSGSTYSSNSNTLVVNIVQGSGLISGYVREDTDGDGDLGDTDSGIAGVTIQLTEKNEYSNLYATTTTDANGFFSFTNLPPAAYSVLETDPPGYTSTADSYGPNNNRANFSLTDGEQVTDIVFLDHNP